MWSWFIMVSKRITSNWSNRLEWLQDWCVGGCASAAWWKCQYEMWTRSGIFFKNCIFTLLLRIDMPPVNCLREVRFYFNSNQLITIESNLTSTRLIEVYTTANIVQPTTIHQLQSLKFILQALRGMLQSFSWECLVLLGPSPLQFGSIRSYSIGQA